MSVTSTTSVVKATATSLQKIFDISDIEFFLSSEIRVYANSVELFAGFTTNVLAQTVTFVVGRTAGDLMVFQRDLPETQAVVYTVQGKFPAASHEEALDRGVMLIQELQDAQSRTLTIPVTHTAPSFDPLAPDPGDSANQGNVLAYETDGSGFRTLIVTATDIATPLTTRGDVLRAGVAGAPERLALGTTGQILESDGTDVVYGGAAIKDSLMAAKGDIIGASADDTPLILSVGTNGSVLTADSAAATGLSWSASVGAGYSSVGQVSSNGTDANNDLDMLADSIVLFDPVAGTSAVRHAPSTVTNATDLTGPAVNGRDQAGAFTASTFIHFYWIWNGTILGSLSSAVAPTTGPTLPSGYDHWCYAGAVRYNGSSQLIPTRIMGNTAYYEVSQNVLTNGAATSETAISCSSFVPSNALSMLLALDGHGEDNTGSFAVIFIRYITGSNFHSMPMRSPDSASTDDFFGDSIQLHVPQVSTQIFYLWNAAHETRQLVVDVQGYIMPNGGG